MDAIHAIRQLASAHRFLMVGDSKPIFCEDLRASQKAEVKFANAGSPEAVTCGERD